MSEPLQCDAWRRRGGAFTFGPVKWEQCPNAAVVMLTVKQGEAGIITADSPACTACWKESRETPGIEILEAKPI